VMGVGGVAGLIGATLGKLIASKLPTAVEKGGEKVFGDAVKDGLKQLAKPVVHDTIAENKHTVPSNSADAPSSDRAISFFSLQEDAAIEAGKQYANFVVSEHDRQTRLALTDPQTAVAKLQAIGEAMDEERQSGRVKGEQRRQTERHRHQQFRMPRSSTAISASRSTTDW
jgi:hypothetical protein